MLILWILLGLVFLLLFLLWTPIVVRIRYHEDFLIRISFLFLSFRYPNDKPKKKKIHKRKPEPEGEKASEMKKRRRSLEELIDMAVAYIDLGLEIARTVLSRLVVSKLELRMLVAGSDACDTALSYGRSQALTNAFLALLHNLCAVKKVRLDIRPDFAAEEEEGDLEFFCKLYIRPLWLLADLRHIIPKLDLDALLPDRRSRRKRKTPSRSNL